MFTRAELEDAANMVRSKQLSLHQPFTVQYSNDVTWEADLHFFRGSKKYYKHAAHFWLLCTEWLEERWIGSQLLWAQRYPDPDRKPIDINTTFLVDAYNLYKNISPESFQAAIEEHSQGLSHSSIPHAYHWEGQIQWAIQMSDEWNDQSFIAETENEYVAFFWETGA